MLQREGEERFLAIRVYKFCNVKKILKKKVT